MNKVLAVSGTELLTLDDSFETLVLPPDDLLATPVCRHADMIFTVFDNKVFFHSSYCEANRPIIQRIAEHGALAICATTEVRNSQYPYDVSLNTLSIGDKLICRKESVSSSLKGYPIINTNQGYAGCTALYAANTVITADESTISACKKNNIPIYRISGKDILLHGYNTGFIGGACGVYEDTVFIYGDPSLSQSGRELAEFCKMRGLSLISLYDGPVTDIGGIKFIKGKDNI